MADQLNSILRKISIISVIMITFLGLIGHLLTILVYSRKKFRSNSCHIFILCITINDSLFLLVNFFEDTIRELQDIFLHEIDYSNNILKSISVRDFFKFINITNKSNFSCISISYLRYILRFTSAYMIVTFTIQRFTILAKPLSNRFKSKKSAWITVLVILIVSVVINGWIPFIYEIKIFRYYNFCAVKKDWNIKYLKIGVLNLIVTVFLPAIIITIYNSLIICRTKKASIEREKLQENHSKKLSTIVTSTNKVSLDIRRLSSLKVVNTELAINQIYNTSKRNSNASICSQIKPHYFNFDYLTSQIKNKKINAEKITRMLNFVSFCYAALNLPHFLCWTFIFVNLNFGLNSDFIEKYLPSFLQIAEIFYVLNYAIYFYINYAMSSVFRFQLKNSKKFVFQRICLKFDTCAF